MSEQQPSPARPGRPVLPHAAVDRAIDRAVRRMVQIDPGPGLGPRVRARIATPAVRRSLYSAPYLAAAGALAMLLLVVGLLRPEVARDMASTTTTGQPAPAAPRDRLLTGETRSPDPTMKSVPPGGADSQAASKAAPAPQPARERAEGVSPLAVVAPADAKVRAEAIPMPEIVNLFGAAGNAVRGANFAGVVAESTVMPPAKPMASPLEIVNLALPPLRVEPLRIPPIPASGKAP